MADIELVIKIPEEIWERVKNGIPLGVSEYVKNGTPLQEIYDRENSEIKNEVKDLSKRVEALEKQVKKEKEEQLKKLNAELEYAKFCCDLPTIWQMMGK